MWDTILPELTIPLVCGNCIMLVKSLAASVAAALLGPTLGIATFFLMNSSPPNSQPFSIAAATDHPSELSGWQTVV
jgi:hypothetical protein